MNNDTQHTTPVQNLRAELKAAGYNARRVSVRSPHGNLELTIRDASVELDKIEEIAAKYESIDRCEYSGEILCGGNTFVNVSYSDAAEKEVAAQYVRYIFPALIKKDLTESCGTEVDGLDGVLLWSDGRSVHLTARDERGYIGGQQSAHCYHDPSNAYQMDSVIRNLSMWLKKTGIKAA